MHEDDADSNDQDAEHDGDKKSTNPKEEKLVFIASCAKSKQSVVSPTLDSLVSYFGNRVEPFAGNYKVALEFLEEFGEKSRVYGVFAGSGKCLMNFEWDGRHRSWLEKRPKKKKSK